MFCVFCYYLIFSVMMVNTAKIIVIIQKRMVIFASCLGE